MVNGRNRILGLSSLLCMIHFLKINYPSKSGSAFLLSNKGTKKHMPRVCPIRPYGSGPSCKCTACVKQCTLTESSSHHPRPQNHSRRPSPRRTQKLGCHWGGWPRSWARGPRCSRTRGSFCGRMGRQISEASDGVPVSKSPGQLVL